MYTNFKALVVVLIVASLVFRLGQPLILRYVELETFRRRRNVWLSLTVLGFLTPSIWIYALIAMPLMFWAAKKDDNPVALYLLIAFAVPDVKIPIPTIGIGQLLDLTQSRMMAISILLPLMFRAPAVPSLVSSRKLTAVDWTLIGLGGLQLALVAPYGSLTNTMREGLIFFLDTFLMFYSFARLSPNAKVLREALVCLIFSVLLLSAIGVVESLRGWLLYTGIGQVWGAFQYSFTAYISRGGILRAQASTGHPLTLGIMTASAIGLWLYFSGREPNRLMKWGAYALLAAGCFVTGSRGAWLTAMLICAAHLMLRPNAGRFLIKLVPFLIVGTAIAYNSPLKELVIDKLPIVGNADQDTVEYRQQIAEVSWRLIKQNPFFGDPFALRYMEELRQGQGIIDIMNGYANVAVFNGGVGFLLFIGTFIIAISRSFLVMIRLRSIDTDLSLLGANLIACLLGMLFFIATAAIDPITYWITGILISYCGMAATKKVIGANSDKVSSRESHSTAGLARRA